MAKGKWNHNTRWASMGRALCKHEHLSLDLLFQARQRTIVILRPLTPAPHPGTERGRDKWILDIHSLAGQSKGKSELRIQ